jgi:hypothetical protein
MKKNEASTQSVIRFSVRLVQAFRDGVKAVVLATVNW